MSTYSGRTVSDEVQSYTQPLVKGLLIMHLNFKSLVKKLIVITNDKVRKCGAEEFYGNVSGDLAKAEYWLEYMQRVLDEMLSLPEDYLRCVVSLLKEESFYLWTTLIAVVPKERVNWEFFKIEFQKKYVSKRYLDKKKKEFLKLKQGNRSVAEYEREFVQLSKYAREIVSSEEKNAYSFRKWF
ncbi:Hexaprenyldihydroxybenzoate methyltransferase, mitochondrial-like protein [Gossypium australe]|uniref:Hexaprenyldihydroxybenzoate methyltransferase, mitochondrial-like protein n=1 Tax=Gossypium australe TaxID=47621 RepID=A0A5B6VCF9_9ROSI|nr:Hexaprenyldihydroxybenzoate methyltransferase, mitochondrial-like protein [Gossypium australe]